MKWIMRKHEDIILLSIPEWEDQGVAAAFTTREGGLSEGHFSSLNLGLHVGDDKQLVVSNRRRVAEGIGIPPDRMVCAEQVHGGAVAVVGATMAGRGVTDHGDALPGIDAMISKELGIYLMMFFADCIPIFFFDPQKRAVAIVHSGWKGTVLGIARNAVLAMGNSFACQPEDLQVFIGPGIGPECFHIDLQRLREVKNTFALDRSLLYPDGRDGYCWDLPRTNQRILMETGVKEANITICPLCTACNRDMFFSYRGAGGITGRMAAVIGLRN